MESNTLRIIPDTSEEAITAAMDRLILSRVQLKPSPFTRQVQLNTTKQKAKVVELLETAVVTIFFGAPPPHIEQFKAAVDLGPPCDICGFPITHCSCAESSNTVHENMHSHTADEPTKVQQAANFTDLLKAQQDQHLAQQVQNATLTGFIDDDCLLTPREASLMETDTPAKRKESSPPPPTPGKRTKPTSQHQPVDDQSVIHVE
ncbi:hypothetical protein R1sor_025299 [Riccia sorocarpa]|uniref:Uncharacterized protein n=1 Tax=Riccia sorocarpa TaxID=122646 RepID=A0ABD3G9L4_9MARC